MKKILYLLLLITLSYSNDCIKLTDYKNGFYQRDVYVYIDKQCSQGIGMLEKEGKEYRASCFKYGWSIVKTINNGIKFIINTCPEYNKYKVNFQRKIKIDEDLGLYFAELHRDEDIALIFLTKSLHKGNKNARFIYKYLYMKDIDEINFLKNLDYTDPTLNAFYGYIEHNGKGKYKVFLKILKQVKYTGK